MATPARVPQRRMRTDVLMMAANKAVVLVAGVGSSILITRALGPSGRGAFAVTVSFAMLLVQLGSLGFQTANPYFTTQRRAPIGLIVTNSLWLAAALGLALAAIGVLVKVLFPTAVAGVGWAELSVALAAVPAILSMIFLQGILLGEGRTLAYNLVEAGCAIAALAALLIAEATIDITVATALIITMSGYVLGTGVFLALLSRHRPPVRRPDLSLTRTMVGYAARIYVTGLLAYAILRLNVLLVNGFVGAREAGFYSVALALSDVIYVLPTVVALNLFPRVARGEGAETSALMFRTMALLYGGVCLVAAVLAGTVIPILYGADFSPAGELFRWLAPAAFFSGMLNILSYHFAGRGYPLAIVFYWALGLVVNLAICVAFLDGRGAYVACIAAGVAYALLLAMHLRRFAAESGGWAALAPRPGELVRIVRGAFSSSPS